MKRILLGLFAWLAFCGFEVAHAQTGGGFAPPPSGLLKVCFSNGGCAAGSQLNKIGNSLMVLKGNLTSRNTLAVPAIDPDLIITGAPIGSYMWYLHINFSENTTATQGFSFYVRGATTIGTIVGTCVAITNGGGTLVGTALLEFQVQSFTPTVNNGGNNYLECWGKTTQTSAGQLSFAWSQSVSNANNTNVNGGTEPCETCSYMIVTRMQ